MRTLSAFPHTYTETEDCWIPMRDGVRLAAKLWLPDIALTQHVPAILEILPYRKRDMYAVRDSMHHRYFAGHGYACLRVDFRGTGDSDGAQSASGVAQEVNDALDVLLWIAGQPWSDGQAGMFGISWGGSIQIQVASRSPPQLKAIMPCSFATDRYLAGQQFRGGCLLLRMLGSSAQIFGHRSRPPDPLLVGERWRTMWLARLENNAPPILAALPHQSHDDFWRKGAADLKGIRCPVYAVSGWADNAFVDEVGRALETLRVPRKGLIGPWGHSFAHIGRPGPPIGFLQEARRWFDHWLRGKKTGIEDEPMLTAWMSEAAPARSYYPQARGRWIAEADWSARRRETWQLHLTAAHTLASEPGRSGKIVTQSPQTVGLDCGELIPWFRYAQSAEFPGDQRADDGKSLCFDSAPLRAAVDVLGAPVATLCLSVNRPTAFVCVRLCDVAEDGSSTRVSFGLFNLTHVLGADRPTPLVPGRRYTVRVPLTAIGYRFLAGRRLRLAVSTSYWPLVWPSPEAVALTLYPHRSSLELPKRRRAGGDARTGRFKSPEAAEAFARTVLVPGGRNRTVHTDLGSDETVVEVEESLGRIRFDAIDLIVEARASERYRIVEHQPLSARAEIAWSWTFERADWKVRAESRTWMACTKTHYIVSAELAGYEGDSQVFAREFGPERIRRKGT